LKTTLTPSPAPQEASQAGRQETIHQGVELQAARIPEAVALLFEDQHLTYRELNNRANRLAHHLRSLGVKPEVLVGICVERSIEMVIGVLGILKAGGAYVPLDPTYPKERIALILEDTRVQVVMTHTGLVRDLPDNNARVICLDSGDFDTQSTENPRSGAAPDNPAYVIYTSGSTGKPKGAVVTHFNVMRLFEQTEEWFQFDDDVWTLFHSYAFDFSVWEMWGPLLYGGRLVVLPYWTTRSPEAFYDLLRAEQVTVLNQTPSAFRELIRAEEAINGSANGLSLELIILGGGALE